MAAPQKVSLYSLSELKTALDDHLPVYLSTSTTPSNAPLPRSQRFTPAYSSTYIRLGLGYSAVAVAAYIFYLDYVLKQEFVDTKAVTLYAVVAYFVLNSALTLWIWLGERGIVFSGSRSELKAGKQLDLKLYSHLPHRKYSPVYRLAARWNLGGLSESKKLEAPFSHFFTEDSYFAPAQFEAWLRQELPLAGKVAGKAALESTESASSKSMKQPGADADDSDTITLGSRSTASESATPTPSKKRGRPRKDA